MTKQQHPITPPPDKIHNWLQLQKIGYTLGQIITFAARWGSDQELEACCLWLNGGSKYDYDTAALLRAARRPQPPNPTEQAFTALEAVQRHTTDPCIIEPLRLALVRLRELEGTDD